MATVHIVKPINGQFPPDGTILAGEPLARPFVTLTDGTVMSFKQWTEKGQPG